ncbi:hypothetical protein NDU88_009441 [Pleurodeles waltl]|uniref:Uncharacterized protein n=1 Tax=Pleurodeles waltl TaxID=8319 RepID=A0AAV7PZ03_PLEWA|nr:hypothetical protein NDU88_009441 [Pleurodeles waltl]
MLNQEALQEKRNNSSSQLPVQLFIPLPQYPASFHHPPQENLQLDTGPTKEQGKRGESLSSLHLKRNKGTAPLLR